MSAITATAYIQGSPVYTNLLAGTELPTIDPAVGRALYETRRPDPRDVYAPTPGWTPPPVDAAPTPAQDWAPPIPCDPRTPYWRLECHTVGEAGEVGPVGAQLDDEHGLRAVGGGLDVPEPGVLVLLALGCAALARRVRR